MLRFLGSLLGGRRRRQRRTIRQRIVGAVWKTAFAFFLLSVGITAGLRWVDPPTSAFMLRSRLIAHSEGHDDRRLHHYWVDWKDIAPAAKIAVIAAEDRNFSTHRGFDLDAIADAAYERLKRGRRRGASTISQQVAKNLYLWPTQSFVRKGLEVYFTVLIELLWPKQRILEVYLNVAQFGDNVFGVEAASVRYFHKSAAQLTHHEAALLAAVLPNPIRYRADRPSTYVKQRSRWILTQTRQLGGTRYLNKLRAG